MPISFASVSFSYSSLPLLSNISFSCGEQERICVVGPNGSGKTTLLRLASGQLAPDSGTIGGTNKTALYSLDAEPALTVDDIFQAINGDVYDSLTQFNKSVQCLEQAHMDIDLSIYDAALQRVTALGAWDFAARRAALLNEFGLGNIALECPLAALSPGQAYRVHLVALLLRQRGVLILDEPTNHLDADARSRLIALIHTWPDGVLFSSHDRDFIERVATSILDLDISAWQALAIAEGIKGDLGAWQTSGTYSDYLEQKRRARIRHLQFYTLQQEQKKDLAAHRRASEIVGHAHFSPRSEVGMAQKFYADRVQKVSTRRKINDDVKSAALAAREVRKPRETSYLVAIPKVVNSATRGLAVQVRDAAVPGRLQPVTFDLAYGEKLLVTGANGTGKTTLLRWIATGAPPLATARGGITAGDGIAYIPQMLPQPTDELIPKITWREGVGEVGKGFLHPKFWTTSLDELSGGNQRRAQIALAVASSPQILLIDEPSNYLDLDFFETLEQVLREWNGTLIIATHDQWLIRHWNEKILCLD